MASEDEIKSLCKTFEQKKALRRNWDWQWERQALLIMPGKADFITQRTPGDPARNKDIYDSTAPVSNHTLASHIHSALTNPDAEWAEMQFRDQELKDNDEAQEWVEDCTRRMFDAINESNFVAAINEIYQDLVCFGTATLQTTFTNDPTEGFRLVFRIIPLHCTIFLENVHGQIDTVFHEIKYTARQAKQRWPDKNIKAVEDALRTDPEKELTFLKIIRPNADYDPTKDLSEKNRKYECVWTHQKKEIETLYYFELEYHTVRWSKMTTEVYGYGLGTLAMPDIETINEAKRLELRGWEKAIDPPMLGEAGGVIGDVHMEAGGFTSVRNSSSLVPFKDQTNWQATQIKSEELRKSIQTIYLIDQLILPERPNATATEVQIRYSMMQRVLGPTAGRLISELLDPMVQRIFGLMFREDQFLAMPQNLVGAPMDIRYTSPLARAQNQDEAQATEWLLGATAQYAQVDPAVLDLIEPTRAFRRIAQTRGVPADVMRSEEEVEKMSRAREKRKAQAEAAESEQVAAAGAEGQARQQMAPMQVEAAANQMQ